MAIFAPFNLTHVFKNTASTKHRGNTNSFVKIDWFPDANEASVIEKEGY